MLPCSLCTPPEGARSAPDAQLSSSSDEGEGSRRSLKKESPARHPLFGASSDEDEAIHNVLPEVPPASHKTPPQRPRGGDVEMRRLVELVSEAVLRVVSPAQALAPRAPSAGRRGARARGGPLYTGSDVQTTEGEAESSASEAPRLSGARPKLPSRELPLPPEVLEFVARLSVQGSGAGSGPKRKTGQRTHERERRRPKQGAASDSGDAGEDEDGQRRSSRGAADRERAEREQRAREELFRLQRRAEEAEARLAWFSPPRSGGSGAAGGTGGEEKDGAGGRGERGRLSPVDEDGGASEGADPEPGEGTCAARGPAAGPEEGEAEAEGECDGAREAGTQTEGAPAEDGGAAQAEVALLRARLEAAAARSAYVEAAYERLRTKAELLRGALAELRGGAAATAAPHEEEARHHRMMGETPDYSSPPPSPPPSDPRSEGEEEEDEGAVDGYMDENGEEGTPRSGAATSASGLQSAAAVFALVSSFRGEIASLRAEKEGLLEELRELRSREERPGGGGAGGEGPGALGAVAREARRALRELRSAYVCPQGPRPAPRPRPHGASHHSDSSGRS
eukprot:tig00020610_g11955.t1